MSIIMSTRICTIAGLVLAAGLGLGHASDAQAAELSAFASCPKAILADVFPSTAECATLTVPQDRAKPAGRQLTLPVLRVPTSSKMPGVPLFVFNGGPGESNISTISNTEGLEKDRAIYYVGYRGADGSSVLDCPEIDALAGAPGLLTPATLARFEAASAACAARIRREGYDLARFSMFDVIDDMEDVRKAIGAERIDLISKSYGTRLAQYYSRRNPNHIHRSVQIASNPPGHFVFSTYVNDRTLARIAELCAADRACAAQTPDMRATILNALHLGARGVHPALDDSRTQLALFDALYSRKGTIAFQKAALAAEKGDPRPLIELGEQSVSGQAGVIWGDLAVKGTFEADRYAVLESSFAATDNSMGSPYDQLFQAIAKGWPRPAMPVDYARAAIDRTETLVLSGDLDYCTPELFVKAELMPFLPNGRLISFANYSHGDYRRLGSALAGAIALYLRTGKVDDSMPQADPYIFSE